MDALHGGKTPGGIASLLARLTFNMGVTVPVSGFAARMVALGVLTVFT
jgi:hypothetical protein